MRLLAARPLNHRVRALVGYVRLRTLAALERAAVFYLALSAAAGCTAATEAAPAAAGVDGGDVDANRSHETQDTVADASDETASDARSLADAGSGAARGVCVATFGDALTPGFGRLDGVVQAVQIPADRQCALPNNDHVILQVKMRGDVYRMVVNVRSSDADSRVRFATLAAPLPAPPFEEGWHGGLSFDYGVTLGARPAAFAPYGMDELVARIADAFAPNDPVAVYATVGAGRTNSAHLVHRNDNAHDGALVVRPDSAEPRFLLFHFANQTF